MFGAHICGCENGNERRRICGLLHDGAAFRFLALHQAHHAHNLKSELAGRCNGLHGRSAGGADVVDDYDSRALVAKTFDALAGPVLLFGLAHQKPVEFALTTETDVTMGSAPMVSPPMACGFQP